MKKKNEYIVNVGNIGNITCESREEAEQVYDRYVALSKSGQGRAGNEHVSLMIDGEPVKEHFADIEEYKRGKNVKGSKKVDVTKGYRLVHGYNAVKGSDKNYNYSKGYKGVRVDAGWRLPHGYEVTDGAYNVKYAKGSNIERQQYNNLIGMKDNSYYFLESIFEHQDGFKGATGVILSPVNKSYYEYATSYDGVIERYADAMSEEEWAERFDIDYEESLEDGTLDEKIADGIWQLYQYGELQVFEEADNEQENQLRDIGLSSEEYPVIEVIGAGRIFSNKNNFEKVFDKNLLAKIEDIEKEEMRTGGVAGSKHVDVTKGYRLPHGYKAVKGSDKNYNYSKGYPKVKVTSGYRLPHGYEVAEGAYNMKYDTGGNISSSDYHRAVNHFVYFCMNYPHNFMDAFSGGMKDHLQSKFDRAYEKAGSRGAMLTFYTELDTENQKALLTWAMNNYAGTKLAEGGLMETDMLTSFDIMAKDKNVDDKGNYVIFKGNRCHCGTTQNKGYQDAVSTAKNQQCGDGLIIKGEMIWVNGRVKGIRLADGREMMYGEYEREYFTEPQIKELQKISKRK